MTCFPFLFFKKTKFVGSAKGSVEFLEVRKEVTLERKDFSLKQLRHGDLEKAADCGGRLLDGGPAVCRS